VPALKVLPRFVRVFKDNLKCRERGTGNLVLRLLLSRDAHSGAIRRMRISNCTASSIANHNESYIFGPMKEMSKARQTFTHSIMPLSRGCFDPGLLDFEQNESFAIVRRLKWNGQALTPRINHEMII
jgi:hypothetical protein